MEGESLYIGAQDILGGKVPVCLCMRRSGVCLPALSLTESGMKRVGSEESVRKLATS